MNLLSRDDVLEQVRQVELEGIGVKRLLAYAVYEPVKVPI
jgi:hypothetical protein